jgi:putative DNA primase/helicase
VGQSTAIADSRQTAPAPPSGTAADTVAGNGNGNGHSPKLDTIAGLNPNHFKELAEDSGLSVDTIRDAKIFSENNFPRLAILLNRKNYPRKYGAGLCYPYFDEAGTQILVRVKPDNPPEDRRGRPMKYLQPTDVQNRLYVPPGARKAVETPLARLLITEGEKKCLKATQEGFATIGLPGVEGWHVRRSVRLIPDLERIDWKNRETFIVFDSDAAENEHVQAAEELLADTLGKRGAKVKVVRLPVGPGGSKMGLDDYLVAHGSAAFNKRLAEAVDADKPSPDEVKIAAGEMDPAIEAEAILDSTKQDRAPRLWFWRGSFHWWRAGGYRELPDAEIRARIIQQLNRSYCRLSSGVVNNVIDQLRAQAILAFDIDPPAWLDEHPDGWEPREIMSTRSGLVHLPSLVGGREYLIPPTPKFFTPISLNYAFDAEAPRPSAWLEFLDQLWGDDTESIDTLQEWFGLCLVADTSYQKILLIAGPKRSGKGTIARVQRQLVGPGNVAGPTLSGLATNFGLWPLIGKTLAVISDARLGGKTDTNIVVERLLSISGEDALTIDRKNLPPLTGKLESRIMILSNELPRLGDSSGALAGRMIVLQLRNSFYGREDRGLTGKLLEELPGILNWSILGWQRLNERGYFLQPSSADGLRGDLHDLSSPISQFLRDRCEIDSVYHIPRSELYDAYVKWCEAVGRKHVEDAGGFGRALRAAVPTVGDSHRTIAGQKVRFYEGVGLRAEWT